LEQEETMNKLLGVLIALLAVCGAGSLAQACPQMAADDPVSQALDPTPAPLRALASHIAEGGYTGFRILGRSGESIEATAKRMGLPVRVAIDLETGAIQELRGTVGPADQMASRE
jgi:hypothetical protein